MQVLLVVDEASEYVFQGRPVYGGDVREAVKIMGETFRGDGMGGQKGLPHKIVFSSRKLCDAMTPILSPVGVVCEYQPEIPKLQGIVADLIAHFAGGPQSSDEGAESVDAMEDKVPALDDLKGWKKADLSLMGRFAEYFQFGKQLRSSRAVKRYFGDGDLEFYLEKHRERAVIPAYTAWGILDYRPNWNSRTHAEKMLAEGLPRAEAILLRARMEAHPTLYRVAGHDPKAGTIDLEDVLLGGMVTVQDRLMSENIEDNVFLAARVFPVGRFHFIELAGPPLGERMGLEAVAFLRERGMEFTPEGLRRDAHMFGWLWRWIDQWQARWKTPHLCNTDGEEFRWHIASFSLTDPGGAREVLMQRPDIEHDEQANELVWNKPAGPDSRMMGETVTLGRMEFVGDELVLSVNSAERLAMARQWLEKLPGVVFKSVRTRCWDEAEKDRPLDERISPPEPVKVTPEMERRIQQMIDQHYMAWIDMPLPVLGGRTPRQACRTEAGRQEVALLIRTMPDPRGPAGARIPREAMLRELGLAAGASTSASAPQASQPTLPIQSGPARPKVARNAPCPCGNGRKYKKCCGR